MAIFQQRSADERVAVSRALRQDGKRGDWLNYHKHRRRAGNILNVIGVFSQDRKHRRVMNEEQCRLREFWCNLAKLRNGFHHHGMQPQLLFSDSGDIRTSLDNVMTYLQTLKRCPEFSLSIAESPGSHISVNPIGIRPGALFSAVQAYREEK